jgi:alkylhydroperoxidase/carboxymuconolactone decarboxylase family protein YurZ
MSLPEPPKIYKQFTAEFPELAEAWSKIADAGKSGPLDDKTARLVKLGVAIGAMREGSVHASVRKAIALGITPEEMKQVLALAAGTLGMPSVVAAFTWVEDTLDKD